MKFRIYTDTSVIGGVFDKEFEEWSKQLIDKFINGQDTIVISDLTLREIEEAPKKVRDIIEKIPKKYREYVTLNDEARVLANHYLEENVITQKYLIDAQHIAIATINKVDVVVSWNFQHIVNLNKIKLYNGVNLKYGYSLIEIRSPREIIYEK